MHLVPTLKGHKAEFDLGGWLYIDVFYLFSLFILSLFKPGGVNVYYLYIDSSCSKYGSIFYVMLSVSYSGLLLRMFMNLYNFEVIDEEAFMQWKEELNDVHPGKGKALFQVTIQHNATSAGCHLQKCLGVLTKVDDSMLFDTLSKL